MPYYYSDRFKHFLESTVDYTNCCFIDDLIYFEKEKIKDVFKGTLIDFGSKSNMISFISVNSLQKLFKEEEPILRPISFNDWLELSMTQKDFWNKNRTEIKVGRFLLKMVGRISDEEIQEFEHIYKSYHSSFNYEMITVKGEDIIKYYNKDFQDLESSKSTLRDSCMSYSTKTELHAKSHDKECFVDRLKFYSLNPNVELLTLRYSGSELIKGRALIWTLSSGRKYIDCPYVDFECDKVLFIKYAKENNFIVYVAQDDLEKTFGDNVPYFEVKSNVEIKKLFGIIDGKSIYTIPHLDTFGYNLFTNKITR